MTLTGYFFFLSENNLQWPTATRYGADITYLSARSVLLIGVEYFTSQVNTKMRHFLKDFAANGPNEPDLNKFAKGDSVLNYMHFLYENRSMVMSLFNEELNSGAGAEGASFLAPAMRGSVPIAPGTSFGASASSYDTEAKRSTRGKNAALDTIAESSATMASASKKRAV